jgi:hypothetical protein
MGWASGRQQARADVGLLRAPADDRPRAMAVQDERRLALGCVHLRPCWQMMERFVFNL